MRPHKCTVKDGITTFHYKFSDWRYFTNRGREHGDVGGILMKREGLRLCYRMFGNIEHPCTTPHHLSIMHHEVVDGKMPTDEERCQEPTPEQIPLERYSFYIIDLSDGN